MFNKFSLNFFRQFIVYKCYHISVVVKDISKIPTVTNSWHVKLEIRIPFKKIRALSEIFENKNKFYAIIFNITG
jgi:hypothetical protein